MRVDLERLLVWILLMFLAAMLSIVAFSFTQDHSVRYHYLEETDGKLYIKSDVNWAPDESLVLDRSITYTEALILVDEMNKQLKENK